MAKRQFRNDMSQSQRDKIAQANTGKKLSQQTKDRISKSMEKYWSRLPLKPTTSTSGGTQSPITPTDPSI